jgi:hypothetical protein
VVLNPVDKHRKEATRLEMEQLSLDSRKSQITGMVYRRLDSGPVWQEEKKGTEALSSIRHGGYNQRDTLERP